MTGEELTVSCQCPSVNEAAYTPGEDSSPLTVVLDAIAQVAGFDVSELPPLYEAVDPEAIERLFDDSADETSVLSFPYEEWNVFVRGDGRIRICDATERGEPAPVFERPGD